MRRVMGETDAQIIIADVIVTYGAMPVFHLCLVSTGEKPQIGSTAGAGGGVAPSSPGVG